MIFLGDVHAEFNKIPRAAGEIIQVGDFGLGFAEKPYLPNVKFIRGNHDDPELCRKDPNYLGEYGIYKNLFFVSGGFSIDYKSRTLGWDLWEDEELSSSQMYACLDLYMDGYHGNFVVSHECPAFVEEQLFSIYTHSRTAQFLNRLYELKAPDFWVFGHHHKSVKTKVENTWFYGLGILELWRF